MAGSVKTLYPPLLSSYMPAFIRSSGCRVYFSLSAYNSEEDISNVQVSVSNQNTNLSALSASNYPSGIMLTTLNYDNERIGDSKYYITIRPSDLENGFEVNQIYKVQLRFTGTGAPSVDLDNQQKLASWFSTNLNNFSEWSTVCLIRGIESPVITIKGFETNGKEEVMLATQVLDFVGTLSFQDESLSESETLYSYEVALYEKNNLDTPITESGILYPTAVAPNQFNYTFKKELQDGQNYRVVLNYTTQNGYSSTLNYDFSVLLYGMEKMNVELLAEADEENGRARLDIKSVNGEIFIGNITIRRTSSESGFTMWEDVFTTLLTKEEVLDYHWDDYTIKSGVWYQYGVQKRNSRGDRGIITKTEEPCMVLFDDIFLSRGGKQLKIKYDPQISSFKRTLMESKVDTIGSPYPYIRRNGNTNYRQFPISGLISHFSDEDEVFTTKKELFGDGLKYHEKSEPNKYRDYIYEREFREKVMDFLYDDNPKLFRSTTEGNILIRLMDVSFSPNQVLGRMVYSFSATAYEVGETDLESCSENGIQDVGEYDEHVEYVADTYGQLVVASSDVMKNKVPVDIVNILLNNKYGEQGDAGFTNVVQYLSYLKIEFISVPQLWGVKKDGTVTLIERNTLLGNNLDYSYSDLIRGYALTINDKTIVVKAENNRLNKSYTSSRTLEPNAGKDVNTTTTKGHPLQRYGFYEVGGDDVKITSLKFLSDVDAYIDYSCAVYKKEEIESAPVKYYYYSKVGQLYQSFDYGKKMRSDLEVKHNVNPNNSSYFEALTAIKSIKIDALPGTVVYIRDSSDEVLEYNRHIIGETGSLELSKDNAVIMDFYFAGRHLKENSSTRGFAEDGEYLPSGEERNILSYTSWENLHKYNPNPQDNLVCGVIEDGTNYAHKVIFYNGEWRNFTDRCDVETPVDAVVDYYIEVERREYQ